VPRPHIEALNPVCTEISKDISFVESTDEPIEVEVVKVVLKKFEHGGIQLWRDDEGGVLYERLANGSKGSWIGRWDSMSKCIVYA
jgi:hypothetical protein